MTLRALPDPPPERPPALDPVRLTHTRVNERTGALRDYRAVRTRAALSSGTLRYLRNRPATRVGRRPRLSPFRYGRGANPGAP